MLPYFFIGVIFLHRYKISLQYDGSSFYGWQLQPDQKTVQGELEQALAILNKRSRVVVTGAGRTDTGVHAVGQVAHFDLPKAWDNNELCRAINGNLSNDVLVMECEQVDSAFHARFSAQRRVYEYNCRMDNFLLDRNYVWNIGSVDISIMQQSALMILGEHDFIGFSKYNSGLDHRRCNVYQSLWITGTSVLTYKVTANRFLHHMVRFLVGTMVAIGRSQLSLDQFVLMLEKPVIDKKIYRAPAHGLVLKKVVY